MRLKCRFTWLVLQTSKNTSTSIYQYDQSLPALSQSAPNSTIKKKKTQTFAHLITFSKNVSAMFYNHKIWTNLPHVLAAWSGHHTLFTWSWCSMYAKDHGKLHVKLNFGRLCHLNYPQISRVRKSGHIGRDGEQHYSTVQLLGPILVSKGALQIFSYLCIW